ncbi:hypothetical protein PPYR_10062 [Photinus pyralis]|uniref:LITAF domain-containing protein n=2 Tax=Photinus pyralis TaxID=7054 RepID=A0A5N4AFB5_PHOPY|nr:hypothetical protein PPYR_10062 [Photinus pyralis]
MGPAAKCRLCGDALLYTPSKVANLGEHLYCGHSKASLTNFSIEHATSLSNSSLDSSITKRMYKTTVETWKPGIAVLTCPSCGKTGHPIVRKQQNKITHSSLGAICLLGCWPLCFLPFMLGGSNTMNIHCKFCGQYLGTFDRKSGRMQTFDNNCLETKPPVNSYTCDCDCKD